MNATLTPLRLRPGGAADTPDCLIGYAGPGAVVVMAIPAAAQEADALAASLAAHPAFARVTIIVPLPSSAGWPQADAGAAADANDAPDRSRAAAAALERLLASLASDHSGLATPISLFGFGEGARVAQAFAMHYPRQVAQLCLVSASWFAMPRPDLPWPYGIGNGAGAEAEPPLIGPDFLDIPTTVAVGLRDTRVDMALRQDALILEHQGRNRLRRARCYVRAISAHAETHGITRRPALIAVHGLSADFGQCVNDGQLIEIAAQALL